MATTGYASALGGLAKDAVIGAGKGFVGGLKGAMMSEAPGLTGAYAFGKELRKRANAPKMPSGGSAPPSANKPSSSSPMAGGLGTSNEKTIVGVLRQSNIINLEQVRQLKQLNDNVINQSKLLKFTVDDTKRKDQFAEEVAKEQAFRDDRLLDAIKRIGSSDNKKQTKTDDKKESSFLGKIGDFISDNIGTLIAGYFGIKYGGKVLGAVGGRVLGGGGSRVLGGIAGRGTPLIGMAGRGATAAADVIDVQARVISSTAARGTLATGIRTIVPMVLRFLTGPVGLGIMAAAGAGAYLYSKRDPEKAAAASADFRNKKLKNEPDETKGRFGGAPLTQDGAKALIEARNERIKDADKAEAKAAEIEQSATATRKQKETARKNAENARIAVDRDVKAFDGLDRVQKIAAGQPDPGGAINVGKYLDKVRGAESGGKNIPNQAGGSAGGVYQIVDSTWRGTVAQMIKNGDKRFTEADLDPGKPGSNVGKFNEAKARMVAEYITEQNRAGLQNKLGRNPTETDLYMAYFMGMGDDNSGAIRFLKEMDKDPAQVAWKLSSTNPDSDIINNNAEVFFKSVVRDSSTISANYPSGKVKSKEGPRSVKALYDLMNGRISGGKGGNAAVVASKKSEAPAPARTHDSMKPAGSSSILFGEESYNQSKVPAGPAIPFQEDLPYFQNLLGGAKAVAPKSTSTNPEREAEIKKMVDKFEEEMKTILEGIKNLKYKIGDSNSGVDENFIAGYDLNPSLFAKQTNIQANPNAHVTAHHLLGIAKVTSDAGQRGGKAVIEDLNAGDSAKDYDRFHKIENRRINENIARIEDERKRVFLTAEKSSYGNNTAPDEGVTSRRVSYDAAGKMTGGFIPNLPSYNDDDRLRHEDTVPAAAARGYSERYLRQAADPDRHGRFWITVEEAKKQLADLEEKEKRKREFLTSEKSSYNTAGVEVSKESNPFVAFIERLLVIFRGERSSSVKLDPSYVDNMHVNDLFRKSERDFRVESDKLASGTILDKGPISVEDEALLKELIKNNKVLKGTGGTAKLLPSYVVKDGKLILATAPPPFKPNFRGNTQILAEANKQFLNELRSTFTGLAKKGLQDALLPNGVGVSFAQASQDNLFRGEQLKQINDTSKKINEGAVKLFGNKFGPMFAPMLDKLSTSYFEVGSRLVGRQLFTRFGGLDDKETMGITGQVLGNIAAGKKQLAAEQLLFGMSGGRERGIALNAESLFAKYGFEDSQQGISYFADVLGEKATQPFSKVFGADDRNKSIVRDPRSGKLIYTDSGKEASKDDIKAGYGGRISQTPLLGKENEYMEVPGYPGSVAGTGGPNDDYAIKDAKGKIIGRKAGGMKDDGTTNSSVTGGSISAPASKATGTGMPMQQYAKVQGNNPTQADLLGITPKQFNSDLQKNTLLAEAQIALMKQKEREDRKLAAEAIKAEAKIAADAEIAAGNISRAEIITAEAAKKANDIVTMDSAVVVADAVKQASGGGKDGVASGSDTPGLRASGRRPGQLFDANVYDKDDKITGKDPMKEIGNFGFDILKLAAGSELTKGISNPYLQTITNFAIQKGMNSAIDAIMDSNIFSKMGSAASSSSSSYGGIGDAFSWISNLWPFKDGGLVQRRQDGGRVVGAGTGTSDSIPALLSNGEFVVNAAAAAANMQLLNAINQSTLPKKNTSGSGTYVNDGGGYDEGRGPTVGSPGGPDALGIGPASDRSFMRDIGIAINEMNPIAKAIAGALLPGFGIASFFSSRMAQKDLDASNVIGGQTALMSSAKATFRGNEIRDQNETSLKGNFRASELRDSNITNRTAELLDSMPAAASFSGGRDGGGGYGSGDGPGGSGGGPGGFGAQAKGGLITGKGSGTSDSIFSMLSNGEFVINAKATKANIALLKQINSYSGSGSVPKSEYERNLSIEPFDNKFKGFADGGLVATANKSSIMNAVPKLTSRSPYILSPPTNNSSSENQNNSSNMIIGPKTSTRIDNSSVTNFYNQASGMIDSIRSITPQVA